MNGGADAAGFEPATPEGVTVFRTARVFHYPTRHPYAPRGRGGGRCGASGPAPMDGAGIAGRPVCALRRTVHPPVVQDGVGMKDRSHLPQGGGESGSGTCRIRTCVDEDQPGYGRPHLTALPTYQTMGGHRHEAGHPPGIRHADAVSIGRRSPVARPRPRAHARDRTGNLPLTRRTLWPVEATRAQPPQETVSGTYAKRAHTRGRTGDHPLTGRALWPSELYGRYVAGPGFEPGTSRL